ncbi:MAG TPA: urease accessory protein UreE [Candidatus Agathobaculum merdipullorum]|nr:urease accessory protein UreE [Candidatus Agathobaculum merdipullorum]
MIADKILGNLNGQHPTGEVVPVVFAWFETEKKRIAKTAADGTELGICVGVPLHAGDVLAEQNGKIYVVEVAPAPLIQTQVSTMQEMGRLCFELGNRHLPLQIEEHTVSVPYDEPTLLYLQRLGFDAKQVLADFSDHVACRAHGTGEHHHAHDHTHSHAHG